MQTLNPKPTTNNQPRNKANTLMKPEFVLTTHGLQLTDVVLVPATRVRTLLRLVSLGREAKIKKE